MFELSISNRYKIALRKPMSKQAESLPVRMPACLYQSRASNRGSCEVIATGFIVATGFKGFKNQTGCIIAGADACMLI